METGQDHKMIEELKPILGQYLNSLFFSVQTSTKTPVTNWKRGDLQWTIKNDLRQRTNENSSVQDQNTERLNLHQLLNQQGQIHPLSE